MFDTLHTMAAFIVAISLLIFVHEFGHFIVARRLGVKVEKFSIGFGPALFSWHSRDGEVEYVLAAIPLGGYVKMLGENPSERDDEHIRSLSEEERTRAFDAQPVWKRTCIAVAGPGFNFLFAILAYMAVAWLGQWVLPPIVGQVVPASVAEKAGLRVHDRIVAVDDTEIHSWRQLEEALKEYVGEAVTVRVKRDGDIDRVRFTVPRSAKEPLLADVAAESVGINPGMHVLVAGILPDTPAAHAGLKAGDEILQVEGEPVASIGGFIRMIRRHAGETITLSVRREGEILNLDITPEADGTGHGRIGAKMTARSLFPQELYRMGPVDGFVYGFERTREMTVTTLEVLGKMLVASISPKNLGGPIAIAQLAGKTASLGFVAFLSFLALISVNLGVLNLLPIPVLDGGHLLYLSIEKVRGAPLPAKVMEQTQMIGMALIALLMLFAFYNDIARWLKG